MHGCRRWTLTLGVLAAAAAAAPPAPAQRPGISFEDAKVEVTLDQLRKGVRVEVHNDRSRRARVRVKPTPFTLAVGAKKEPASAPTRPAPAVTSLTSRAERWIPESNELLDVHDAEIPLRVDEGKPLAVPKDALLGVLAGDDGSVAEVFYTGETKELSPRLQAAEIRFEGMGPAGEYKGKIDTLPNSPGGEIDLKLVLKDAWIWALLPLLAGMLIALWRRQYVGAGRASLLLGARDAALDPAFTGAKAAFASAAAGKPWQSYDSGGAFRAENAKVREALVALVRGSFDKLEEGPRKAVEEQLAALEAHVAALPAFAAALARLEALLANVEQLPPPTALLADGAGSAPAFLAGARKLLDGRPFASLADFAATRQAVQEASALAAAWPALQREATRAAERVARVEQRESTLRDTDRERLVEARGRLKGAWQQLWDAEDAASVTERGLVAGLREAVTGAYRLAGIPEGRADEVHRRDLEALDEQALIDAMEVRLLPPVAGAELGRAPAVGTARVKWLRGAVRRGDGWQMLVAGVVALYSGLEALYFGHDFGGPWDYVKALAWGLGATTALDLFVEALRQRLSLART